MAKKSIPVGKIEFDSMQAVVDRREARLMGLSMNLYISRSVIADFEARGVFPEFRPDSSKKWTGGYLFHDVRRALACRVADDARERCWTNAPALPRGAKVSYQHLYEEVLRVLGLSDQEDYSIAYGDLLHGCQPIVACLFGRLGIPAVNAVSFTEVRHG